MFKRVSPFGTDSHGRSPAVVQQLTMSFFTAPLVQTATGAARRSNTASSLTVPLGETLLGKRVSPKQCQQLKQIIIFTQKTTIKNYRKNLQKKK